MRVFFPRMRFGVLLAALAVNGCSVQDTEAPPLAGPSELALALRVTASPDMITQDGVSQSSIAIEALGPEGRPVRALPVRLELSALGEVFDHGSLSSKTVVTGDDGRARVTYTSPPRPFESTGRGTMITILATPMGTDYASAASRSVDLRLVPPGVILPPNGDPVPSFAITPSPVTAFTAVTFDASGTTDEGVICGARCSYSWSFGDGGTGAGIQVRHEYRAAGSYNVRLTVVDDRGQGVTATQSVSVAAAVAPTADFVFSPTDPTPGSMIFFNASASRAGTGRRILFYEWDFGSGRTDSGVTVSKGYNTPGTYAVTLKVTDDADQVGVVTKTVAVKAPTPAAGAGERGSR